MALAMQLLELNNISTQNSTIVSMSGEKAADKLVLGELDAAFCNRTTFTDYPKAFTVERD